MTFELFVEFYKYGRGYQFNRRLSIRHRRLLDAIIHEEENEAEQTESQTPIALKTEDQMQQTPIASKTGASYEQPPEPSNNFP